MTGHTPRCLSYFGAATGQAAEATHVLLLMQHHRQR